LSGFEVSKTAVIAEILNHILQSHIIDNQVDQGGSLDEVIEIADTCTLVAPAREWNPIRRSFPFFFCRISSGSSQYLRKIPMKELSHRPHHLSR
jgi:hypothetical protein